MYYDTVSELCRILHQSRNRITSKQWAQLSRSARNMWLTVNLIRVNSRKFAQ